MWRESSSCTAIQQWQLFACFVLRCECQLHTFAIWCLLPCKHVYHSHGGKDHKNVDKTLWLSKLGVSPVVLNFQYKCYGEKRTVKVAKASQLKEKSLGHASVYISVHIWRSNRHGPRRQQQNHAHGEQDKCWAMSITIHAEDIKEIVEVILGRMARALAMEV